MGRRLLVSPLGLAAIFLTGCVAGSAVQALSGGSTGAAEAAALMASPAPTMTVAKAEPLTPKAVKTFAVHWRP